MIHTHTKNFIRTLWHPRCFRKKSVGLKNLKFGKCYFQTQEKLQTALKADVPETAVYCVNCVAVKTYL